MQVTASAFVKSNTTVYSFAFPSTSKTLVSKVNGNSAAKPLNLSFFVPFSVTFSLTVVLFSVREVVAASAYAALKFATDTASLDFSNCEEKIGIFLFK